MWTKIYVIFQAEYNNLSVSNVQREIEQLRNDLVYLRPKRLCEFYRGGHCMKLFEVVTDDYSLIALFLILDMMYFFTN